ncbi:hypothetical protein PaecuDRAFT_4767 [Paenibacillus curdlanolyticus YK9]|uniref:DUF4097 domain-containing protein n=1 Tax=Paenibacillus curdlanolyticus YK9 TaxID=717606 RepID=E0IGH4_9BACL|nr:DUF4097 family beta strand repeat-containing protein [Paenibacillus curdlanolyticus]EFM08414.1 hypothetical protein PaecuDRAFT_4767 [Paenibacillus curdlanolyticus YK9]
MRKWVGIGLILIAVGVVGLLLPWSHWREDWFSTVPVMKESTLKADGVKGLAVHADSEDVRIVPGKDGVIVARLEGKISKKKERKINLETAMADGVLDVKVKHQQSFEMGVSIVRLKLTLEVPSRVYDSLSVNTDSGDIELVDLSANEVKLESDSGDMALRKLQAKSIAAASDSGDQLFEDTEGALRAKLDSGDVRWRAAQLAWAADVESDSGDVVYELSQKPVNGTIDFRSDSGDGAVGWGAGIVDSGGTLQQIFGSGDPILKVRTDSGDFTMGERK